MDLPPGEGPVQKRAMQLFLQHSRYVETVAFHLAPEESLQHDIVYDSFIEFVENADKFDLDRDVKPLLRGITRNIAHRHWRTYLRKLPDEVGRIWRQAFDSDEWQSNEAESLRVEERLAALDFCMKKLSPISRKLLELYYYKECSYATMAEMIGQKVRTLTKTMTRIRQSLKVCIEKVLKAEVDQ